MTFFRTRKLDPNSTESASVQALAINLTVLITTFFLVVSRKRIKDTIVESMLTAIVTTMYVSAGLGILGCILMFNIATVAIKLARKTLDEQNRMYIEHLGDRLGQII